MFNLVVDFSKLETININDYSARFSMNKIYKKALPILKREVSESFNLERRPSDLGFWIKAKAAIREKRKTLHRTGKLENLMQNDSNYVIYGNTIKELIPTDADYGKYHNRSENFNYEGRFPWRQFAGVSADGVQDLVKEFSLL